MGQTEITADGITAAVLEAMSRVAPPGARLTAATPINMTALDSLALIEAMVHLEDVVGTLPDENIIRKVALEPCFHQGMTIYDFAQLLLPFLTVERQAGPSDSQEE